MSEYVVEFYGPDSQVVGKEIVRCMDCVHFTSKEEFAADVGIGFPLLMAAVDTCDLWANTKCMVEPDGFCAWAVRRVDA